MDKIELREQFVDVTFMELSLEVIESKAKKLERVDKIAKMLDAVPVSVESCGKKLKIALSKKFKETFDKLGKGTKVRVLDDLYNEVCEIVSDKPFWCDYEKCVRVRFEDNSEGVFDVKNMKV